MGRKRIGLIVPSSNTVMEVDFYRNLSPDITSHSARMFLEKTTVKGEEEMLDKHLPVSVNNIKTMKPDAVIFGCTSAGALRGNEYEKKLCEKIENCTGAKTISVMSAVQELLGEISPDKIAVLTPYIDDLNSRIKNSLNDKGYNVVKIMGMNISNNFNIALVTPKDIYDFSSEVLTDIDFDCIFLSCTNFRAWEILSELNDKYNLPVISSNFAVFYKTLKELDYDINWEQLISYKSFS